MRCVRSTSARTLPYDSGRIEGYIPNQSRWLLEPSVASMRAVMDTGGGQKLDTSTYSKAIAERFLVDLAWASSNLQGNTYDHLSTKVPPFLRCLTDSTSSSLTPTRCSVGMC